MARFTQQPFEFYSESATNLDTKPTFSEEDEMSSVLDEKILDSNPDANGMSDLRRLSYDHHVDALAYREQNPFGDYVMHQPHLQSHQQHHQSQVATAVQSDATRQASHLQSSMSLYDSNSQFMRLDTTNANAIYAQQTAWQMPRGSGSCTPTPVYDQYAQDYDASSAGAFSGGAVGPVSAINFGQMSSYRSNVFGGPGSVAMSPQSSQGWVQPGDIVDGRPAHSPSSFRPDSNMHLRRDGIRKKNARFEIPPERTLNNIDHLIQQSTNEEEIKELKQQKRLLRNRQAALDSRQRKKLHTEKLEEEKKHFTTAISDLEEALHSQQMREKELIQENNNLSTNIQHFQQYVESLRMEKDELIRVHTLETAELRKKNNILRETMDKMEQQLKSMSNTHLSHAFGTTNGYVHSEYDNMHMETGQWDEMSLVNNISLEAEGLNAPVDGGNLTINTNTNTNGHEGVTALIPAKNDKVEKIFNNQNSDYPFSWNAFYMCLLFGAFIASNSSSLSSPAALPQLSDEYRAESANVLKAVLASAPGDATSAAIQHSHSSTSFGRHQFGSTMAGAEMAHMSGSASVAAAAAASSSSTLDNLHNTLALPTKQQENDQVFALNVDQYNALTTFHDTDGHNPMDMGDKPAQPQPSNLQQALAAMRGHGNDGRTSQVYSRSLMWDRVPEKVVRDFQRMVRECGSK